MLNWENVYSIVEPQITADGVHVWPFETALPVDVRFFDFSGKTNQRHDLSQSLRMTRHDYCELLYVEAGAGTYQVQEQLYPFERGDLLVIGGMHFHRLREFHRARMRAAALYFRPEAVAPADTHGDEQAYLTPFLRQGKAFPHVISAATGLPKEIFALMQRIHHELPAKDQRARLAVKTYLKMALMSLVNHYATRPSTAAGFGQRQQALDRLQPLFEQLERCYAQNLTVEQAAALVGLSRSHFMRFFRQVTGQSFIAYLNLFRIAKAQVLLTTTETSLAEISYATGFCDQSYFSLIFRKLTGLTPLQYRQAHISERY